MHNRALRNDATHQYNLNLFFIGFGFPPYFTAILKPTKKNRIRSARRHSLALHVLRR